jgi:hypothetical protein
MKTANDGVVWGPIWLSKGERFRPTGAYIFLESRYKELQLQLKKLKKEYKQLMIIIIEKRKKKTVNYNESDDDGGQNSSTEGTDKEEEDKINEISLIQDKSLLSMTKKEMRELKKVKKNFIY